METKVVEYFGGSFPVDNVQALAATCSDQIPARYLRAESELGEVCSDEAEKIPVIDMSKLEIHGGDEVQKLHLACKEWGFFQLINHGVSEEAILRIKTDMAGFFELPLEKKMVYSKLPNYMEGYGQSFVFSEDQKLDWGDLLSLVPQPIGQRNLRFWPESPPSFRTSIDHYSSEMVKLSIGLLRHMARNLRVDPVKFVNMFEEGIQVVRMNYYPHCAQANKVMGFNPHSDGGGLTLLIQANDVDGLQIKRNGKWLPVKPIPGAFIVNIGNIIEIMSNGEYESIEHRVIVNPEKERLSIAALCNPNIGTKIGPLMELSARDDGARYKTLDHKDYIKLATTTKLDGKNRIDLMKL